MVVMIVFAIRKGLQGKVKKLNSLPLITISEKLINKSLSGKSDEIEDKKCKT